VSAVEEVAAAEGKIATQPPQPSVWARPAQSRLTAYCPLLRQHVDDPRMVNMGLKRLPFSFLALGLGAQLPRNSVDLVVS
jgi:hypothetical protein